MVVLALRGLVMFTVSPAFLPSQACSIARMRSNF